VTRMLLAHMLTVTLPSRCRASLRGGRAANPRALHAAAYFLAKAKETVDLETVAGLRAGEASGPKGGARRLVRGARRERAARPGARRQEGLRAAVGAAQLRAGQSDRVAKADMTKSGASKEMIDFFYGWNLKEMSKDMFLHYAGLDRMARLAYAYITAWM
jgi:hypothetical protein